jgi:hypothetical protein
MEYYGVFPGCLEATIITIIVGSRRIYIHLNVVVGYHVSYHLGL